MKSTYIKPDLFIQSFDVCTLIASSLGVTDKKALQDSEVLSNHHRWEKGWDD